MRNRLLDTPKIGQVVDNEDPKNRQRVRVAIPFLTEGIPLDRLPWYPQVLGGNNNKVSIPPKGTWVYVEFPNGDIYNGIVKGTLSASPIQ